MGRGHSRISRQLTAVFATIYMIVSVIAVISLISIRSQWTNTEDLYLHPLQVRRAIGSLQVDILSIHREMNHLVFEQDLNQIDPIISRIQTFASDTNRQTDRIKAAYLGPQTDVDRIVDAIDQWHIMRLETIRLKRAGDQSAHLRTSYQGIEYIQVDRILELIEVVSNFAVNKADEFYKSSYDGMMATITQLAIIQLFILVFLIGMTWFLRNGITKPLTELTAASHSIQQGDWSVRSKYQSINEYGQLSDAFNQMAQKVEDEMRHKDEVAGLSSIMIRESELKPFCEGVLTKLMKLGDMQAGAIYFVGAKNATYELVASIGPVHYAPDSIPLSELNDELSLAVAMDGITIISEIPQDKRQDFKFVSGDYPIRSIMTIPVLEETQVIALISLSSVKEISRSFLRVVEGIQSELSARIKNIQAISEVRRLTLDLQKTNGELGSQTQKLSLQTDELTEQNIELEIQKQKLDEASQLKNQFLANMSHELRTPLNAVISLASVLNRRLQGKIPDDEYSYLSIIERNGRNLLDLVNEILDLSKIEAGKNEIHPGPIQVKVMLKEIMDQFSNIAKDKGIGLHEHIPEGLPILYSDDNKCRHILQNLIGNAIKFTETGAVDVQAATKDGGLEIRIIDSGIGIAKEHLGVIFDEFRQVDGSSSRKRGGAGLGLAIARKYTALINGSIHVESKPGRGSIFTLWLPMQTWTNRAGNLPASMEPLSRSATIAAMSTHKTRPCELLLIEDNEPAIIQIKDILSDQNYQIHSVRNGLNALEYLQKNVPDGIILDLVLPDMDGFKVLEAIRNLADLANVPVLIMTAKRISDEEDQILKMLKVTQVLQKGSTDRMEVLMAVHKLNFPILAQASVEMPGAPTSSSDIPIDTYAHKADALKKPRILVVEDNPDNMLSILALLREAFELISADNGHDAIRLAEMEKPDLILMDISLPGIDGIETMKRIRQQTRFGQIPILALTAHVMVSEQESYKSVGFDCVLPKPIDQEMLINIIRSKLDGN